MNFEQNSIRYSTRSCLLFNIVYKKPEIQNIRSHDAGGYQLVKAEGKDLWRERREPKKKS